MDKKVYDSNFDEGYKRLLCTQLNNMITYAKKRASFSERLKYLKRTIDNPHIRVLFSDVDYIVKKKMFGGAKAFSFRMAMMPIKLYFF